MDSPLDHHLLTDDSIKRLNSKKITTILAFYRTPSESLCEIAGLEEVIVKIIKTEFHVKYEKDLIIEQSDYIEFIQKENRIFPTGIQELDILLDGGIKPGSIIELSGDPTAGKTQLCTTLVVNIMEQEDGPEDCYWLDTKNDFSAIRYERILSNKHKEGYDCLPTMKKIHVQRAFTKEMFFKALEYLEAEKRNGLIIIDSLSALFGCSFDITYKKKMELIQEMMNQLRKLCFNHGFTVIVTSLDPNDKSNSMQDTSESISKYPPPNWDLLPTEHFLLERTETDWKKLGSTTVRNSNKRFIRLINSVFPDREINRQIMFSITDHGIV